MLGSQGKKDKFLLFLIPGEVCSQVVPGSLESLGGKKGGRIWTNLISRESEREKERDWDRAPGEVRTALHLRSVSLLRVCFI